MSSFMSSPPPPPPPVVSPPAERSKSDKPALPPRPPDDIAVKLPSPPKSVLGGLKAEPVPTREVRYNPTRQRESSTSAAGHNTPLSTDIPPPKLPKVNYLEKVELDQLTAVDGGAADASSVSEWFISSFSNLHWIFLLSLYCCVTANLLAAEVSIDIISEDLRLDSAERIIVLPVTYLLMSFSGIWYGHMSDTNGRRQVLVPSLFLFSAASVGLGFAPDKYVFCTLRILQAIGGGSFFVVDSITRDISRAPLAQLRLLCALQIFRPLGIAIGSFGGDYLATNMSWRYIFWGLGGWSFLTWMWLASCLPETRPHYDILDYYGHYNCREACCKLIPRYWFIGPIFLNSLVQCVFWFLFMTLGPVLIDSYGLGTNDESICSIVLHSTMAVSALIFYIYLRDPNACCNCCKHPTLMFLLRIFMSSSVVLGGCFAALYFLDLSENWLLYYIPLVLTAVVSTLSYPVIMTILMQEPEFKANTGAVIGWEFFFRTLCMLLVYGWVNEYFDLSDSSSLAWWSLLGVASYCVWFWIILGWRKASDEAIRHELLADNKLDKSFTIE